MAKTEFTEVWVCVDCYFAHHYPSEHAAPEGSDIDAGRHYSDLTTCGTCEGCDLGNGTCDNPGEHEFSGSPCAACGTMVAGSRHRMAWWED